MNNKNSQDDNYDFGLLSAIWILACNDDAALMLYRSIEHRLGSDKTLDLKKLIGKHGELFRKECPESELLKWKQKMLKGVYLPSWIRDIPDEKDRKTAIDSLTVKDVFRSQFRPQLDSPPSTLDIINWGLEHLERARKYKIEANEQKWKKWKEVGIPIGSLVIALVTVILTSYWQYENIQEQRMMKLYEISFKPRQEGYSVIMDSFGSAFESAAYRDGENTRKNLKKMESGFFSIKPFLTPVAQTNFMVNFAELTNFLNKMSEQEMRREYSPEEMEFFRKQKVFLGITLYKNLFEDNPSIK
jgi:hypothetical protein